MFQNNSGARYAEDKTPVIRQIDAANIEETDDTIGFYTNIDRLNAKYYILMFIIILKNEDFEKYLKDRNNNNNLTEKVKEYKKLYSKLKKKATFNRYTNPAQLKQGELLSKQYKDICETQLVENHILATLKCIFDGETPSENTKNYDFEIEDIGFKKIAEFQKNIQKEDDEEKVYYDTHNALKAIMDYLPEFYKDDKLVLEVLGAIKKDEQNKDIQPPERKDEYKERVLSKIVAILTSEVEEKKVNDKIVEEVITCATSSDPNSEKKSFISKVTIGGIEFKKENIEVQETSSSGAVLEAAKRPTYFKQPGSDGKMKRYYINKETNYIFETPDKNIDDVDDNDEVRIYDINSGKWYDNKNNAVCKKSAETNNSKGTIFSFYNEENKQFFYCSPFSNKVYINDCKDNKICKGINSITSLNVELDHIIEDIKRGSLKDGDGSIDSACKKIGINIDYVPDVLCGKISKLEALRRIRKYGLFNMISPIRTPKETPLVERKYEKEDLETLINASKKNWYNSFGLKSERENEDVRTDFSRSNVRSRYEFDIGDDDDDDDKTLKALKIEHFLSTTRPKNTLVLEYKNGEVVKDSKIDNFNKSKIEDGVAFSITAGDPNACSYSKIILDKRTESGINHDAVETELNNPFSRKDDLSEYAFFNYEHTKKVEELAEEENKKKRKKNKRNDQKEKDYADLCKQQKVIAVSSITNAVRQLYNMKYKSFFEKILCFFGLMEDKTPREYNNLVNTIVRNINGISFSEKEINYIQKAIDNGAAVSGEVRYNIINAATISLNNLNRGKEK